MIAPIAWHTFLESLRNRVLYALLLVVVGVILSSVAVGYVAVEEQAKIVGDIGLSAISFFGAIIAIFLGTSLVHVEVERRTLYTLLARSVRREEFLVGKLLGLALTVFCAIVLMSLVFFGYYWLMGGTVGISLLFAIYMTFLELFVVIGVALNLSVVSTPVEGAIITFLIYLAGHASGSLLDVSDEVTSPVGRVLIGAVYYIVPNLHNFNVRLEAIHNVPISAGMVLWRTVYAACYTGGLVVLASLLFRRKTL